MNFLSTSLSIYKTKNKDFSKIIQMITFLTMVVSDTLSYKCQTLFFKIESYQPFKLSAKIIQVFVSFVILMFRNYTQSIAVCRIKSKKDGCGKWGKQIQGKFKEKEEKKNKKEIKRQICKEKHKGKLDDKQQGKIQSKYAKAQLIRRSSRDFKSNLPIKNKMEPKSQNTKSTIKNSSPIQMLAKRGKCE
ncbi:hypothetical protein ABPG72_016380 [Tetrahymena utriculariae]